MIRQRLDESPLDTPRVAQMVDLDKEAPGDIEEFKIPWMQDSQAAQRRG
jgi:hypothetical protein